MTYNEIEILSSPVTLEQRLPESNWASSEERQAPGCHGIPYAVYSVGWREVSQRGGQTPKPPNHTVPFNLTLYLSSLHCWDALENLRNVDWVVVVVKLVEEEEEA